MAWLNHAGTSWPKPAAVHEAAARASTADPGSWAADFDRAHRAVSTRLGVADPARLLLSPGCTSALAVAIADHPWTPGDVLAIGALEHHALHRPCLKLAQTAGVELAICPDLPAFEEAFSTGRVRLVATAAAANTTGELAPIEALAALARAHGALLLVDAAQVAGWVPDLAALGDLVCFAGHKGPQAPWGIGGLIAAPDVILDSPAATCEPPADGALTACALMPGYCDVGSVDRVALAGLEAGLGWLGREDPAERLARARSLVERLVHGVRALGGRLHGPEDPRARMAVAGFSFPDHRPGAVGAGLAARGVHVSAGLQCAPLAHRTLGTEPWGIVRFSAGPSTTGDDIEQALDALKEVLR